MNEQQLKDLAKKAETVGERSAQNEQAHAAEREAACELLAAVIDAVRPGLRAVSSRPVVGSKTWWPDNIGTQTEEGRSDWYGLHVAGDLTARVDHPRANTGGYEGSGLWLLPDGTFRQLEFSGHWSRWQGSGSEWTAAETTPTMQEVVQGWRYTEIVEAITVALDKELASERRQKRSALAIERAARMRAVAELLKR